MMGLTREMVAQDDAWGLARELESYPYLMSPAEVADFTGMTRQDVTRRLRSGEMPGFRIGVRWRISRDNLLRFLYEHANAGGAAPLPRAAGGGME